MASIKAFKGFRPPQELAEKVASRPYDVLNSAEARVEAQGNAHSFLHINKPEIDVPENVDLYDESVYQKGRENLDRFINEGYLVQDDSTCMYIYRQEMWGKKQTGLVACSSIDDYFNDIIKKHEFTRPVKENDRIKHMETLSAHVGPVFLTYPAVDEIDALVNDFVANNDPVYDFDAGDGVQHTLWVVNNAALTDRLSGLFEEKVPFTYIADGHHRAASSAKVGKKLRDANPNHNGSEHYNHFLSVLFPANQLTIIDYNRVLTDLNGHSKEELLEKLSEHFDIEEKGAGEYKPQQLHEFSMYLDGNWYKMTAHSNTYDDNDPIGVLDVTILSEKVFGPIFGIEDLRRDKRIEFVGGIRGLGELSKRVNSGEMAIAFALYPVTIEQLINIADSGNVMPPKSTWFEPKLRSGLVIHQF